MTIPAEQLEDAHKLEGDGIVYLYEMTPRAGGIVYFKANNSVTWQGHSYTGTAVQIDGRSKTSDGTLTRPKLTLANPNAIYSSLVAAGSLDNATLVEKKVLYAHITGDNNIYSQCTWRVRRITSLNKFSVVLELRDTLDGQRFLLPARMYIPPYFPAVST